MGRLAAIDMLEHAPFDQALRWHLTGNHYPSMGYMYDAAMAAIEAGNEREFSQLIDLPEGVLYRGAGKAPAGALIESLHLDEFLSLDEDEEFYYD